jgi:hypothetical protein
MDTRWSSRLTRSSSSTDSSSTWPSHDDATDGLSFSFSYTWILIAPDPKHHTKKRAEGGLADVLFWLNYFAAIYRFPANVPGVKTVETPSHPVHSARKSFLPRSIFIELKMSSLSTMLELRFHDDALSLSFRMDHNYRSVLGISHLSLLTMSDPTPEIAKSDSPTDAHRTVKFDVGGRLYKMSRSLIESFLPRCSPE